MNLIDTIADIIDGIKALPACAEAARELAEFERDNTEKDAVIIRMVERARLALNRLLPDPCSVERILRGTEIESDYIDKHDDERLKLMAERDLLQRKLDYLLRPRKQSEEPCPFGKEEHIFGSSMEGSLEWYGYPAKDLVEYEFWRPVDLTHFEEYDNAKTNG